MTVDMKTKVSRRIRTVGRMSWMSRQVVFLSSSLTWVWSVLSVRKLGSCTHNIVDHLTYYQTSNHQTSPWKPQGRPLSPWLRCATSNINISTAMLACIVPIPTTHCCKHYNYKIENILWSIIKPEGRGNLKLQYNID